MCTADVLRPKKERKNKKKKNNKEDPSPENQIAFENVIITTARDDTLRRVYTYAHTSPTVFVISEPTRVLATPDE